MDQKKKFAGLTLILSFICLKASANHGLQAMGDGLEILFSVLLAVLIITGIAFIMASRNISRKRRGIRIATIILSMPLLLLTLGVLKMMPPIGLLLGGILIILWMVIYKSYEPYKNIDDHK